MKNYKFIFKGKNNQLPSEKVEMKGREKILTPMQQLGIGIRRFIIRTLWMLFFTAFLTILIVLAILYFSNRHPDTDSLIQFDNITKIIY